MPIEAGPSEPTEPNQRAAGPAWAWQEPILHFPVPTPRYGARLDGSRVVHLGGERNGLVRRWGPAREFVASSVALVLTRKARRLDGARGRRAVGEKSGLPGSVVSRTARARRRQRESATVLPGPGGSRCRSAREAGAGEVASATSPKTGAAPATVTGDESRRDHCAGDGVGRSREEDDPGARRPALREKAAASGRSARQAPPRVRSSPDRAPVRLAARPLLPLLPRRRRG